MANYTLHKTKRLKANGEPKAGPAYRYEVRDNEGAVVSRRDTDREFVAAYEVGSNWSYCGNIGATRGRHNFALLQQP